ncbi:M14 family metallopeptidase [Sediminicola luteus]|uniref:Peptidase M14 domain-containing protein n=1 Tax=Sediminicola luteus TaxID=319238 RepID=A0A2A4GE10_9FLAO|nr:M14 family metallopeptidase [Sediminicola luteus]PCE66220.1 hypothetical protein B7P33_02665 [Sediminicola luteus]
MRTFLLLLFIPVSLFAQSSNIYWGNAIPENWNGDWPNDLRTACEKSGFTHTATHNDIMDYLSELPRKSELVSTSTLFVSDRGLASQLLIMANPRISSAQEAKASGKPVIYLQGGIHPGEPEGKEALLMVIRDILFGEKKHLLDNLIILVNPNFNVDGNETRVITNGDLKLMGTRRNAAGYDVNRDALKLQTKNMQGAVSKLFAQWDPILIYDTHRMEETQHGYAIAHGGSNVPTAHAAPRDYVTYNIFPALVDIARKDYQIEVGMHCGLDDTWPPKVFSHDNSIWSTEGKFMVSGYGLRNRMAIITETPERASFEKAVYAQYAYTQALLTYCHTHGQEMKALCEKTDAEVVAQIKNHASSGQLTNFTSGKYVSDGALKIPAYRDTKKKFVPGSSVQVYDRPDTPEWVTVDLVTKPIGTHSAKVPNAYLLPESLKPIVDKLKMHGVQVSQLEKAVKVNGERYRVDRMEKRPMGFAKYPMTTLLGDFEQAKQQNYPAGTYLVSLEQPLANLIFYCLEPQVRDGLMGWQLMDDQLQALEQKGSPFYYPVFKVFGEVN